MKRKKFLCMLFALGLCVSTPISSFAADINQTNSETETVDKNAVQSATDNNESQTVNTGEKLADGSQLSITDLYGVMNSSLQGGTEMSLSDAYNLLSPKKISQDPMVDTSDTNLSGNVDFGSVNLQYDTIMSNMKNSYDAVDVSGGSTGCIEALQSTYGDVLGDNSLSEPKLPEGFDAKSLISQDTKNISSVYGKATSSGSFKSVKGSIHTSDIFAKASAGPTSYSLKSAEELSSTLAGYSSTQGDVMKEKFDASNNYQASFDSEKENIADWYKTNEKNAKSSRKKKNKKNEAKVDPFSAQEDNAPSTDKTGKDPTKSKSIKTGADYGFRAGGACQ